MNSKITYNKLGMVLSWILQNVSEKHNRMSIFFLHFKMFIFYFFSLFFFFFLLKTHPSQTGTFNIESPCVRLHVISYTILLLLSGFIDQSIFLLGLQGLLQVHEIGSVLIENETFLHQRTKDCHKTPIQQSA